MEIDGVTPLFIASNQGRTQVVETLLFAGADPNIPKKNQVTPIFAASQNGYKKIVEQLLLHHARPNVARERWSNTTSYCQQTGPF